uniref:Col_cuticle_N domain-containing protein n=1 Tax=Caenorhabditis tropicalis TaxID=1561998 RepID=A0A1I7T4I0_9PELO
MGEFDLLPPQPLQWNAETIATCAAIVAVMVVNIIGLVFTILWCLRTKEDGIELGNGVAMNQFVEPNIRMKLKLPKVRGDAIRDSAPDVFELRVPRNGNQFNACHEQTVIVSRNKRRRTYSVPLESRPRTQSTGSQQLGSEI